MALTVKRPKRDDNKNKLMQDVTEISENKKRLNAIIGESLYKQIKLRSVEEGRTISDITRDLWSAYLSK